MSRLDPSSPEDFFGTSYPTGRFSAGEVEAEGGAAEKRPRHTDDDESVAVPPAAGGDAS